MLFLTTWPSVLVIASLLFLYVVATSVHSCYFGPLSKFPGPKIAALTQLYEAYHVLLKNDWLENLQALHKKYGPVVRLGPNELHFVDHAFCLTHHKRTDLYKCDSYYGILNKLLGGFAHPSDHMARKAIVQPLFTGKNMAHFSSTALNDYLDTLHERLADLAASQAKTPGPVNMTYQLWAYTNDVMVSYLLDKDEGFMKKHEKLDELVAMHDRTRAFSAIDLATLLRAVPLLKVLVEVFPFLRRSSQLGWTDDLILKHLRPIMSAEKQQPLEEKEEEEADKEAGACERYVKPQRVLDNMWHGIRDETLVMHEGSQAIFIGNESMLSNMSFLLHNLAENPHIVANLRAEIDDKIDIGVCGHRVWTAQNLLQLPYLDAICRESTRLSAPGWHRQPRQVTEPVNYHGTMIPPMTSLSFTVQLLEKDPLIYPEPDKFKPERWLGESPEVKKARQDSITWGTGSRMCLGRFIAPQVLRKTVAAIVYNYDVSLWDGECDKAEGYRYLDTYPKKGTEGYLRVKLTPRFAAAVQE